MLCNDVLILILLELLDNRSVTHCLKSLMINLPLLRFFGDTVRILESLLLWKQIYKMFQIPFIHNNVKTAYLHLKNHDYIKFHCLPNIGIEGVTLEKWSHYVVGSDWTNHLKIFYDPITDEIMKLSPSCFYDGNYLMTRKTLYIGDFNNKKELTLEFSDIIDTNNGPLFYWYKQKSFFDINMNKITDIAEILNNIHACARFRTGIVFIDYNNITYKSYKGHIKIINFEEDANDIEDLIAINDYLFIHMDDFKVYIIDINTNEVINCIKTFDKICNFQDGILFYDNGDIYDYYGNYLKTVDAKMYHYTMLCKYQYYYSV